MKVKVHWIVKDDSGTKGDLSWDADLKINPLSTKDGIFHAQSIENMYIDCMPKLNRDIKEDI